MNPSHASLPTTVLQRVHPGFWPSLLRAVAWLWLPTLLPLAVGPLSECGHCVRTYLMLMPLVPGTVGLMVRNAWGMVLAVLLSLALLAALTAAFLRLQRITAHAVGLLLACVSGAQALLLGNLLRM